MSWDSSDTTFDWATMEKEATTILEGEFPVTIIKSEAVKTANGKDMVKVRFKVDSGTFAGRVLFTNFVISPESPNAMRMFFTQLAVFGLDSAFFASITGHGPEAIAQALDGRRAIAVVAKAFYQGQPKEEIKSYKPALGGHGGGTFVPGLGSSIGGVASSSPLGSPSPSSFNSPIGGAASGAIPTSAPTSPAVAESAPNVPAEPVAAEPSSPPPPVPAF